MNIAENLNNNRNLLSSLANDLLSVDNNFKLIDEENVKVFSGKESKVIDEVNDLLTKRKPSTQTKNEIPFIAKGIDMDYVAEHQSMESILEERLDILKEAINILDTTENSNSKLEYLTKTKDLNPHLLDIGYVNIVENDLKEKLAAFAKKNKIQYFNIVLDSVNHYDNASIAIMVSLKGFDGVLNMFTRLNITDNNVKYPQRLQPVGYTNNDKEELNKITNKYNNLTTEIKAYELFISDLESGMVERYTNKRRIEKYKALINEDYKELVMTYVNFVEFKDTIIQAEKTLNRFYKELPKIEREQDLIFEYLSTLLNKDFIKENINLQR